jgi:hypothetical protein
MKWLMIFGLAIVGAIIGVFGYPLVVGKEITPSPEINGLNEKLNPSSVGR